MLRDGRGLWLASYGSTCLVLLKYGSSSDRLKICMKDLHPATTILPLKTPSVLASEHISVLSASPVVAITNHRRQPSVYESI